MNRPHVAAGSQYDPPHLASLDGLRGIAILLVIPHNTNVYPAAHNWMSPLAALAHAGWIGVQLFFVLSGFLITRNLLASRGSPNYYSAFFARRVLRIFPLYFLVLIVLLILLPAVVQLPSAVLQTYAAQWPLWFFLSNWTQPNGVAVFWFPHYWSLAIEEQFYLLWPFIVAFAAGRRLIGICTGVICAAFVCRVLMLQAGASAGMIYMYTVCRIDALAAGAATAALLLDMNFVKLVRARSGRLLALLSAALLVCAVLSHDFDQSNKFTITLGYSVLAVAFAALVAICAARASTGIATQLAGLLCMAWLRRVGRYSFGMYIFHLPITLALQPVLLDRLERATPAYPLVFSFLIALLSYFAGMLSFNLLERHFLGLKRYFNTTPASAT